jgi:hypothetical protein
MMDSKLVDGIEKWNRQDAKFAERKRRGKRRFFKLFLFPFLSVSSLRTWRLGGSIPGPMVGRNPPPWNPS